ncbi:hypothetical protein SAMN05216436_105135 [bacterium A37T11]|nr:hypothetical protein SAMN05216436_105135 [bacterium A37T11]
MYTFKRIAYISLVLLFLSAIALRAQTNLLSPLHVGDDLWGAYVINYKI